MKFRKCPICDGKATDVLGEIHFWLPDRYSLPNEYSISACKQCGFCYADTSASLEDYNCYYSNCNTYSGSPIDIDEWNTLHITALEMIREYVKKTDFVLDMGFGKGVFMRRLHEEGYTHIYGIDPSQDSVSMVERFGIGKAYVGSIFERPDASERYKYKCVFLFDVLEHLLYPQLAVRNLTEYVEPKGYVLISVPNYASLAENNTPIPNIFNQEHINYFSLTSLDNLLMSHGMRRISTNLSQEDVGDEIVALYCKDTEISPKGKDTICHQAIRKYLEHFDKQKEIIEEKLIRLNEEEHIYVWGTGAYTAWLLANTKLGDFSIEFIDNNKTKLGKNFYKSKIHSPEYITQGNIPIVICSMLYAEVIEKQIREMGLNNEIIKL